MLVLLQKQKKELGGEKGLNEKERHLPLGAVALSFAFLIKIERRKEFTRKLDC